MYKWYMLNQESILENETYKLHWDFEIKTDPLTKKAVEQQGDGDAYNIGNSP